MGRIQSSIGLITGTDIVGTVDQLIAISARPRDRLISRTNLLQQEQGALAELTALVIGVQLSGNTLNSASLFRSKQADSSNADSLSVAADSGASVGTYTVRTLQTAGTHTIDSLRRFDSADEGLGYTGTLTINPDGFVDHSLDLSELNNGRGVDGGSIRITDRSGTSADIDLSGAKTIDEVLTAINDAEIDVTATTDGAGIKLIDQTGETLSNLVVEQLGDAETAADLGLYGVDIAADSVTGSDLTFTVSANSKLTDLRQQQGVRLATGDDFSITVADGTNFNIDLGDPPSPDLTIQDVVDQLNLLDPAKLSASFTGGELVVNDLTSGTSEFTIADATGANTASDLGLSGSTSGTSITAEYEAPVLRGTALDKLAGGAGLGSLTSLDITLSDASSANIDLSQASTTSEIIDAINASTLAVTAKLNDSGTGLRLRDVSGGTGNFVISSSDSTASLLGVEADTSDKIVVGDNLRKQTVNESTLLSELNQAVGVDDGSFTITDSDGVTKAINISVSGISSVGDLIDAINDLGISVTASLNDHGDGIAIVDTGSGAGTLTIEDTGTGTTAADLRIEGEATLQTVGGSTVSALVGSQSNQIEVEAEDSLAQIVEKINTVSGYGTASIEIADDGRYSLRVRSNTAGAAGRFGITSDGFDLDFKTQRRAADALIAVSTDGGEERLFSSTDGVFSIDSNQTSVAITSTTLLADFDDGRGVGTGSFTITDSSGVTGAVNIRVEGLTTIGELVDEINSLGIGVTASINDDGDGIAIVDNAGGSETLTIEDVGNGTAAASLGLAGTATTQTVGGKSVSALVGSPVTTSDSDTTGLVLTLKELSADPITITVTDDSKSVTSAAQTFVDQYNLLVDKLDSLTFFDSESNEVGLLFGSSEALRIRSNYSRLLSGSITSAGNLQSIGQVGLRFNDQGKLDFNSSEFSEAIETNHADVEDFFTSESSGLAARLNAVADGIAGEFTGLLLNRTQTLTAQIEFNSERVDSLNSRLEKERERLLLRYYSTEEAIAKIQSNLSVIDQIQPITIPTR